MKIDNISLAENCREYKQQIKELEKKISVLKETETLEE